ncbi:MAG: MetQ/NlpA family ABC transporter substrate-binding protein [Neisseriaceae bacterium]|nr:methionine ABC transporter substrate-binding protein [Neisseriaceae bacterium]
MSQNKLKSLSVAAVLALGLLAGCGGKTQESKTLSTTNWVIGVTGGPHEQVVNKVKELAAKDGITIDVKVFSDYNTPNTALAEGSLDMNNYQTLPFLVDQKNAKGYKITEVFETTAFPMAIYSDKIKDIKALKSGDRVAVPNDPANELRALRLFEAAGLIKLKEGLTESATKRDIAENPLNLEFLELPAAQLPSQLPELAAAAINANFALSSNLSAAEQGIFKEASDVAYPNYVVVRDENVNDEAVALFKKYYYSDEVRSFINDKFQGAIVPLF